MVVCKETEVEKGDLMILCRILALAQTNKCSEAINSN